MVPAASTFVLKYNTRALGMKRKLSHNQKFCKYNIVKLLKIYDLKPRNVKKSSLLICLLAY